MKGEPMIAKELLEKVFTKSIHKSVIQNYQTDDHEKGKGHYHYTFSFAYSQELWEEVRDYLGFSTCENCLKDNCICKEDDGNPKTCRKGKCKQKTKVHKKNDVFQGWIP